MDNDLIAVLKFVYADERTRQTVGVIHMTRKYAVSDPGWEGSSFQPSGLITQPGDVPCPILFGNAHDRYLYAQRGNFNRDSVGIQVGFSRHIPQIGHDVRRKTSLGQRDRVRS